MSDRDGGRGAYGRNNGMRSNSNKFYDNRRSRDNNAGSKPDDPYWEHGNYSGRNRGHQGGRARRGGRGGGNAMRNARHNSISGYNSWNDNQNKGAGHFGRENRSQDPNTDNDHDSEKRFNKFKDPQASPYKGNNFSNHQRFDSYKQNNSRQSNKVPSASSSNLPTEEPVQSSIRLNEPTDKEPKLLRNIKTEKRDSACSSPKPKGKKSQAAKTDTSSSSDSSSEEEEPQPLSKSKSKEKQTPALNVHIKQERSSIVEKKKPTKEPPPPVVQPPSPSTESPSDAEKSSSSESSSSEEEIPEMPQPIKAAEVLKMKKERTAENDVVCLGKLSNVENLIDEDEACLICQKTTHPTADCQMQCTKCSHSSYERQMVCKNCGETYPQCSKSLSKPPNPFVMFMQFMQFCMSQYFTEIKNPLLPTGNAPTAPAQQTQTDANRKDKASAKQPRKRRKSESKQLRKKQHAANDSNSDSKSESSETSAKPTSSKKRKKQTKTTVRESEKPQVASQQQLPNFAGPFPAAMQFPAAFNAPAYNPMLAFSQMMGFNPTSMNFNR